MTYEPIPRDRSLVVIEERALAFTDKKDNFPTISTIPYFDRPGTVLPEQLMGLSSWYGVGNLMAGISPDCPPSQIQWLERNYTEKKRWWQFWR